jgi:hypothetical protein
VKLLKLKAAMGETLQKEEMELLGIDPDEDNNE